MILKDFLPNTEFREFVQCYRIVHFEFDKTNILVKAYPPKPEECLHFFLRGHLEIELANRSRKEPLFPITLIGQQTAVTPRYNSRNLLNFQIVFQPGGVFRLTGIPAFELTNKCFDAEDIFPKSIRFVFQELQQAKEYGEMLNIADRFITTLVSNVRKDAHLLDSASKLVMQTGGNISLDWLAKESCLCLKQFKRKFNERVGVNPKSYGRIVRFTKAFNYKNAYPRWDWLDNCY